MERAALKRYDYYSGPKTIGDLWTLKRGQLTMRCVLSTHRLGWELKLTTGTSTQRSQACRSESEVDSVSEAWQTECKLKGWG